MDSCNLGKTLPGIKDCLSNIKTYPGEIKKFIRGISKIRSFPQGKLDYLIYIGELENPNPFHQGVILQASFLLVILRCEFSWGTEPKCFTYLSTWSYGFMLSTTCLTYHKTIIISFTRYRLNPKLTLLTLRKRFFYLVSSLLPVLKLRNHISFFICLDKVLTSQEYTLTSTRTKRRIDNLLIYIFMYTIIT